MHSIVKKGNDFKSFYFKYRNILIIAISSSIASILPLTSRTKVKPRHLRITQF
jgi:hypothetical protein